MIKQAYWPCSRSMTGFLVHATTLAPKTLAISVEFPIADGRCFKRVKRGSRYTRSSFGGFTSRAVPLLYLLFEETREAIRRRNCALRSLRILSHTQDACWKRTLDFFCRAAERVHLSAVFGASARFQGGFESNSGPQCAGVLPDSRKARYPTELFLPAAEHFEDRTDVQCLHRWQKVLNPELIKGPWSPEVWPIYIQCASAYANLPD